MTSQTRSRRFIPFPSARIKMPEQPHLPPKTKAIATWIGAFSHTSTLRSIKRPRFGLRGARLLLEFILGLSSLKLPASSAFIDPAFVLNGSLKNPGHFFSKNSFKAKKTHPIFWVVTTPSFLKFGAYQTYGSVQGWLDLRARGSR